MTEKQEKNIRRVFGRRIGRPLNAFRQSLLDNVLPRYAISENILTEKADLDPASLFEKKFAEHWMEIGFGNGEHLAALLRAHPDKGFLGAEPFINGMTSLLKDIAEERPQNLRLLMEDAMKIVHSLKDRTLARLYILNPDPWPKKRHHKRRIINSGNLDAFSRVLKPGGMLIMATDVADLADWMIEHASAHPDFEWDAGNRADCTVMPAGWLLTTRYADKGIKAGRTEKYLLFKKK